MKKSKIIKKIMAFGLTFALAFLFLAPFVPAKVSAEENISVPASMVSVSKTHATMTKLGTKINIITNVIKGWGSIRYANANYDGSIGDWADLALAYFSGNADEREEIADLKQGMNAQFDQLSQSIDLLFDEVKELKTSVNKLSEQLEECALKTALNTFYTEFYYSAYTDLVNAYNGVSNELKNPNADLNDIVVAMDLLYIKAMAIKELGYYVTGENRLFDNKSIVELYYDYLIAINDITSADDARYAEVLELTQDFTLKIYSADVLQKYCVAFVSAFQHNYVNQHRKQWAEEGKSIQYEVSGNISDDVNKLSLARIQQNVELAETGAKKSAVTIAKFFTKIYNLSSFVGYKHASGIYYAKTTNDALNIYEANSYAFFTLPNEIEPLFKGGFNFKSSDPSAVQVTKTGTATVVYMGNPKVTLSYVYSDGDEETVLYSLTLNFIDKKWQGGYGNEEAPYLISTAEEFLEYANDTAYHSKFIRLLNDIDLSGKSFSSISTISGGIDGNHFKISGLKKALVLYNNGIIKNLTIETQIGGASDFDSNGKYVGEKHLGASIRGGVASVNNGIVENCHVENSYVSLYTCNFLGSSVSLDFSTTLGGIVGENNGIIRASTVKASTVYAMLSTNELFASGQNYTGGSNDLTLFVKTWVGGIAGKNTSTGSIENCYVADSNVKSTAWTTYFFNANIFAGMSTKYNRINSTVYHAVIAGENGGSVFANQYYNVSDSAHKNHEKAGKDTKEGLVTFTLKDGHDGISLVNYINDKYLTQITVEASPLKTDYDLNEKLNFAGLMVVDDYGNFIYGFSVSNVQTNAYGEKTVLVNYKGLYYSFKINVKCRHYDSVYVREDAPTCQKNGYSASLWCNDCSTYVSGNIVMEKSTAYCVDSDKNNYCDLCGEIICNHEDLNDNHICDLCGDKASVCLDKDKNHLCDICGETFSVCLDKDNDHACDACGQVLSECLDANNNHKCDTCGKVLSECLDENLDNRCDICDKILCIHRDVNNDHICDNCSLRVTLCSDGDNNHLCDVCGVQVSVCLDGNSDHLCDICNQKISNCKDVNDDHACDTCGAQLSNCADENNDHNCDTCGQGLTECLNENNDHVCDICGQKVSNCLDENSDHACDICGAKITNCFDNDNHLCDVCGKELSKCADQNNDHNCDVCGKELSNCVDANNNHNCDICGRAISNCLDKNNDHACDICGAKVTNCFDNDDHLCDTCGQKISNHVDGNKDHVCDICSESVGNHGPATGSHNCGYCNKTITACGDNDNNHICDICGERLSNCLDNNNDHACDICKNTLSYCSDQDGNHLCDLCAKQISNCLNANKDHKCDICGAVLSTCADGDSNHNCDECGTQITNHSDTDKNKKCDICGVDYKEPVKVWVIVVSVIGGIALFSVGLYLFIDKVVYGY